MIITGRITARGEELSYQTRNGETKSLIKFRLTAGPDNIFITAFAELVPTLKAFTANQLVVADMSLTVREWQNTTGGTQWSNEAMLNRIAPL